MAKRIVKEKGTAADPLRMSAEIRKMLPLAAILRLAVWQATEHTPACIDTEDEDRNWQQVISNLHDVYDSVMGYISTDRDREFDEFLKSLNLQDRITGLLGAAA